MTLMAESEKELKGLLMKVKEESEKAGAQISESSTFKKLRSWHSVPAPHANRRGKKWKQ